MIKYRADVDGLRSIAVISVILFHYFHRSFPGGFVGVDVFFVISGYIITSVILNDIGKGIFSFSNFYERRIKRIIPCLLLVIAFSFAAAHFVFLPADYKIFTQSAIYSSLFSANIFFWMQSGYFDTASHLKPLLHIWSLGVEEQFYIIFPVLLFIALRFGRNAATSFVFLVFTASLCVSIWGTADHKDAAFFLLPFRAWELALGSLLALLAPRLPQLPPNWAKFVLFAGLGAILLAVFRYSSATVFPGIAALLPCAGAALAIYAGQHSFSFNILEFRPLVFLGKISYGLYLWHWPPYVFLIYMEGDLQPIHYLMLGAITLGAATISYFAFEMPIRRNRSMAPKYVFASAALATVTLIAGAGAVVKLDGVPSRLPDRVNVMAAGAEDRPQAWNKCHTLKPDEIHARKWCILGAPESGPPEFILWGDSHAHALMPALDAAAKKFGRNGAAASHLGCLPVPSISVEYRDTQACNEFNQAVMEEIKSSDIKLVILAAFWSAYIEGWPEVWIDHDTLPPIVVNYGSMRGAESDERRQTFEQGFRKSIEDLTSAGKTVLIVGQVPNAFEDAPSFLARRAMSGTEAEPLAQVYDFHIKRQESFSRILSRLPMVRQIDPVSVLCPDKKCYLAKDGKSLYYDRHHVSVSGAEKISPVFWEIFDQQGRP